MKKLFRIVCLALVLCVIASAAAVSASAKRISYRLGDADTDEYITILDATVIQRKLALYDVSPYSKKAADADEDGSVTILDATAIQRYLAQYKDPYPIGETFSYDPNELPFVPN